ncbi:hypothetical protein F5879DRAFT_1022499 [Lentinula edodes]|nr:hypothetical protein F5879DRAFT_1022499 [Lentinula edodes]
MPCITHNSPIPHNPYLFGVFSAIFLPITHTLIAIIAFDTPKMGSLPIRQIVTYVWMSTEGYGLRGSRLYIASDICGQVQEIQADSGHSNVHGPGPLDYRCSTFVALSELRANMKDSIYG